MKWKVKPALTRQAWLGALARRLVWFFPAVQMKEILSDYQEQFDEGHDHCRTEAEIIQALGTPAEAAGLLLEEEPSAWLGCLRHSLLWGAVLAVCCFFLWVSLMGNLPMLFWSGSCAFILAASAALFLLLRGPSRMAVEKQVPPDREVSPVTGYYIPFALMLVFEVIAQLVFTLGMAGRLPKYIDGPFLTLLILIIEMILAVLAVWLLFRSTAISIRYFPGIPHILGVAASLFFVYAYMTTTILDTLWIPAIDLLLRLLPYFVGLAAARVFQRWVDGRSPLPRFFQGSAATWQDWRHRLGVCLLGWFPAEQTLEILEDYQEQYELGREKGKSEDALLDEMGHPETVVRDLLAEDRKARLRRRKTWVWAVLAGLAGWLLAGLLRCFEFGNVGFGRFYWQFAWQIGLFALLLGTASLFFLLRIRERMAVERRFPAPKQPAVWLLLPPLAVSALVESLALYAICNALDYRTPVFLGKPITWYILLSIEFSAVLLALLLIWTLNRCVAGSIRHFPALPPIAGSFAHVLCIGIYMHAIDVPFMRDDPAGTVQVSLTAVYPFLAGLVLAAVLWGVLRTAGRKEG